MPRFTATTNAFSKGIENTKPKAAIDLIEDWQSALADLDVRGAKGIARDLQALHRQLEASEPDAERIKTLVGRLGAATTKIAGSAEKGGDKLKALGEALTAAGGEDAGADKD